MQTFLPSQNVALTIDLIDTQGNVLTPSAVAYRVTDENETEIIERTSLAGFVPGNSQAQVSVLAAHNGLDVGKVRELRLIDLYCTTESGEVFVQASYLLEAAVVLVAGVNSFQTYAAAELAAMSLPDLRAWPSADRAARLAAMLESWYRIGRLRFRIEHDDQDREDLGKSVDFTDMTPSEWAALDEDFKVALRRAQLLDADWLLDSESLERIRLEGLMSKTVGESSQMYQPGLPVKTPIAPRAMSALSRYLIRTHRIARG